MGNKLFKVRFNLGLGKNYLKWKITYPDKSVEYLNPNEVQLILINCKLKNNKTTANKIFHGSHKSVCAWVECERVVVSYEIKPTFDKSKRVSYNPRKTPNWVFKGENFDNHSFDKLISIGFNLIYE